MATTTVNLGLDLDGLSNVDTTGKANGNTLVWNSVSGKWEDSAPASGITIGTTAITSGTVGRILFEGSGNVVQEDSALFWDNTNKRLGIGATPSSSVRLDVRAQGALSTDIAFRVRNSANGRNIVGVTGDNKIYLLGESDDGTIRIEKGSGHVAKFIHRSTNTLPSHFLFGTEAAGGSVGQFQFDALNGSGSYPTFTMQRLISGLSDLTGSSLFSGFGTNAATFVMKNAIGYAGVGVNPTGTAADHFAMYSADIVAGNAAPHFRTENGDVQKIYSIGGWGTPTGTLTRTTFDTTTVTLGQLAERVAALISDLKTGHGLLKA